jgi:hypothetical protein
MTVRKTFKMAAKNAPKEIQCATRKVALSDTWPRAPIFLCEFDIRKQFVGDGRCELVAPRGSR